MTRRRLKIFHRESAGEGMFGWIAVQVHAKMVAKQLMTISDVLRVPNTMSARGRIFEAGKVSVIVPPPLAARGAP